MIKSKNIYPVIPTWKDDLNINPVLAARSFVAGAMLHIGAIAAWYEDGTYYFYVPKMGELNIEELQDITSSYITWLILDSIHNIAKIYDYSNYPKVGVPIIDPIYFGT